MMRLRTAWLLLSLLGIALAAHAGDVVSMPTGNVVQPNHAEFNYIFWNLEKVGNVRDHAHVYELFVGAAQNLEVDLLHVDLQGIDKFTEVNAYYTLQPETPAKPSLVLGVTNLFGSDWLPSEDRPFKPGDYTGDDRLSPFVLGAYNLRAPQDGPPTPKDPLIRAHLGLGFNYHEDRLFGAVQCLLTPQWGAGIFNYRGNPAYLAVYKPKPEWEVRAGWFGGDPLVSVGYSYAR
jgi:hypothetical protein